MTTCNDIVTLALSRLRQIRAGDSPTGTEAEYGLTALQSLYTGWINTGLFGRMNDTVISSNYTAQEQDRVINDGGYTVTLPTIITPIVPMGSYYPLYPDDRIYTALQSTQQRPPRDLSMIAVVTSGVTVHTIYDARTRAWVPLDTLALPDTAPLANRGVTGLASCLAEILADEFGAPVTPGIAQQATMFKWGLSSRYSSQRVDNMATYF